MFWVVNAGKVSPALSRHELSESFARSVVIQFINTIFLAYFFEFYLLTIAAARASLPLVSDWAAIKIIYLN